jgi:alpha-tubulin suppressor-like RCC1 family protein
LGYDIPGDGPKRIPGLPAIAQVGAGEQMSRAIDVEGRLWTWGLRQRTPTQVEGLPKLRTSQTIGNSTLVISETGELWQVNHYEVRQLEDLPKMRLASGERPVAAISEDGQAWLQVGDMADRQLLPVPGLSKCVQALNWFYGGYMLREDGSVWEGTVLAHTTTPVGARDLGPLTDRIPNQPIPPRKIDNLPTIKQIAWAAPDLLLLTQDGELLWRKIPR